MIRSASFLFILVMTPVFINAQTIFLKNNSNCMNRLEFVSGNELTPFIAYSFFLGNQQMAIFDIGKEHNAVVKELKEKLVDCSELLIDKALVRNINNGTVKIILVKERPGFFELNTVNHAGFIGHALNTLEVISPDAEFILYTDRPESGQNLAKPESRYEVYLKGIAPAQCASSFTFEFKEAAQSSGYQVFTVVPGLGFLEKRKISGAGFFSDETTHTTSLKSVNAFAFRDYLTMFCDKRQSDYYEGKPTAQPSVYGELVQPATASDTSAVVAKDPCAPSSIEGVHVVQKGETLYGIARRYGISVEQIRTWNKIEDADAISICKTLFVKQPNAATNTAAVTSGSTPSTTGDFTSTPNVSWISAPSVHVVRPGETVPMLANLYGYTEERFRRMNSLSPTETLTIGQKLHTSDCICPEMLTNQKQAESVGMTSKAGEKPAEAEAATYFKPVKIHVVQKDDTLFSIAQKYSTTPERILELNGMKKTDAIKLNQRLYVQ